MLFSFILQSKDAFMQMASSLSLCFLLKGLLLGPHETIYRKGLAPKSLHTVHYSHLGGLGI